MYKYIYIYIYICIIYHKDHKAKLKNDLKHQADCFSEKLLW